MDCVTHHEKHENLPVVLPVWEKSNEDEEQQHHADRFEQLRGVQGQCTRHKLEVDCSGRSVAAHQKIDIRHTARPIVQQGMLELIYVFNGLAIDFFDAISGLKPGYGSG